MGNNNSKWKSFLLKSGLPYEYEVFNFLETKGLNCIFDSSYLRNNENNIEKEFSFDILAINNRSWLNSSLKLHIECKYKQEEGTKWLFLPKKSDKNDFHRTNWLAPIDILNEKEKFKFHFLEESLGPTCLKRTEFSNNNLTTNSIPRAISQLSFSFADEIIKSFTAQMIAKKQNKEFIIHHIPIICTNAPLFRLKEGITTNNIKSCNEISEIADEHPLIIIENDISLELKSFNKMKYQEVLKKLKPDQITDKNFYSNLLSLDFIEFPKSFLVINFSEKANGFEKLFPFIDRIINPSKEDNEKADLIVKLMDRIGEILADTGKKK